MKIWVGWFIPYIKDCISSGYYIAYSNVNAETFVLVEPATNSGLTQPSTLCRYLSFKSTIIVQFLSWKNIYSFDKS